MERTARQLAVSLIEIGAVLLRPERPFVWASGWKSPIYCDNRRILSHPALRDFVAERLAERVLREYPEAGTVAGVATGAIALGVLVADRLKKPFVYVRPKPKDHGTGSQIEGELAAGAGVVVVEDLISTGGSSLAAVKALREAGAEVRGMVAVFTYGFELARDRFAAEGVRIDTLSDYGTLVETARESGRITEETAEVLRRWRLSPSEWDG